ncbi:hypothetical protein [Bradyrhizobium yuanmingense]|uniref:hypothetical protein n=1 Tax=Bradyrhizobium yuanmingense TaxID=108015 RepID=UPI0012FD840F|nr:hypothetical protein [Bradyrhizobium yuanmingense]
MCQGGNDQKRQISSPPHAVGFFNRGEFVYDPDADWTDIRTGMIVNRGNDWLITQPPMTPGDPLSEIPLTTYGRRIGRHILIDHSGLGQPRGPTLDPTPWSAVAQKIRTLLRDADSNRLRIEAIRSALKSDTGVDPDLIDDTLRMFASMGAAKTYADAGGTWYSASPAMEEGFSRRHYLSTFSDELLAKSRRIDHLIRHTGTVGTDREELLRSTIRQLLPTRYQANTGFMRTAPGNST